MLPALSRPLALKVGELAADERGMDTVVIVWTSPTSPGRPETTGSGAALALAVAYVLACVGEAKEIRKIA